MDPTAPFDTAGICPDETVVPDAPRQAPAKDVVAARPVASSVGLAIGSRNGGPFPRYEAWSSLFQAEQVFIDLTYRQSGRSCLLEGQVILGVEGVPVCNGTVSLREASGATIAAASLSRAGDFFFTLPPRPGCHLTFELAEITAVTPPLPVL